MKSIKKAFRLISSMQFAMLILALITVACVFGSVIPQGESASYYSSNYSSFAASAILKCGLDDVFHVWWFVILTIFLCASLLFCNLVHIAGIIRRMNGFSPASVRSLPEAPDAVISGDPSELFSSLRFSSKQEFTIDGKTAYYSARNRIGVWGAWLTHLGILVIIIGFALGQMTAEKHTVYGVAGQTKHVEGTDYSVSINDFQIQLREDDTVQQYISNITITNELTGEQKSGETSVNHPLSLFGMKIYQNSTGWAADALVFVDDELVQTETVCAGEYTTIEAVEELYLVLYSFFPDYVNTASGPATASSKLNNPAYLYMLYHGDKLLGMNVLTRNQKITVDNITIIFNDPRPYSLLQLKTDHFTGIAFAGALIILAALVLAFYIRPEELWAVYDDGKWAVYGRSRKGGILFKEAIAAKAAQLSAKGGQ